MNFALLLVPPLLSAFLAYVVRPYRVAVGWTGAWLSLVSLGSALAFAASILAGSEAPTFGPSEMLRADSLSALPLACIAARHAGIILQPGPRPREPIRRRATAALPRLRQSIHLRDAAGGFRQ